MSGKRIWKVSYHGGNLSALVETATPARAVEIAKAHRLRKFERSTRLGKPGKTVIDDDYTVAVANERDIAWARGFGVGVFTDRPLAADKRPASSRKRLAGSPEGAGGIKAA